MTSSLIRMAAAIGLLAVLSGQAPSVDVPAEPPAAAVPVSSGGSPAAASAPALEVADLGAWLDGIIPAGLAAGDIAGATVSVVKDGKLLFARGYGFADVEKRTPVTANRTLFRTGSVSKLATWTAVMQLVEAGKLDLDQDVNAYLDFKIPPRADGPITLRDLMTHTGGFEERAKNLLVHHPDAMVSLEHVVKDGVPERIYPAGAVPAYSNYGAALAGYIVQRVSGLKFQDYVDKRIFAPLGMRHSTFREPVPAGLRGDVSKAYLTASEAPTSFEYVSDVPAGAQSATATDMARFMLACLNGGALPGAPDARIMRPETVRRMFSVANRPTPAGDAMAHGFYEENRNGYRVLAHGGDLVAFHSDLHIIPSENVGIFVSFNSLGKDGATYTLRTLVYQNFMDRYFPRRQAADDRVVDARTAARHADAIAGRYRSSRRFAGSLFSFFSLIGQNTLSENDDGTIEFDELTGASGTPLKLREVSPWLWREVHGQAELAARRTASGDIAFIGAEGWAPTEVSLPVPAGKDATWIVPGLFASAAVLLIALLVWPAAAALRRYAGRPKPVLTQAAVRGRWGRRASALACLAFLLLLVVLMMRISDQTYWIFTDGATGFLRVVQAFALLSVVAAVVAAAAGVRDWLARDRNLAQRAGATLQALACLMIAYVVIAFHFLTPSLHF